MKLDQLQYFVETARRQHIGQAARFLAISPSAISHSIAALEEEFGQILFEKQGRQIKLTHHGKLLLDRAEFLLSEVGRIKEELSSEQLELRGHYRVAATHLLSSSFLTPAWMSLQIEHPALSATLLSLRSADVLTRAGAGEIDLGFCISPNAGPHLEQEVLFEGKLVLSFGKKHPFLKDKKIEDLNHHAAIAALGAQGIDNCENHPSLQKLRITQKIANLYDSYEVAVEALRFNNTWALLPDFIAHSHKQHIETYIPRGWEAPYRITAIWPRYRIRTPALDQLVEGFKERIVQAAKG